MDADHVGASSDGQGEGGEGALEALRDGEAKHVADEALAGGTDQEGQASQEWTLCDAVEVAEQGKAALGALAEADAGVNNETLAGHAIGHGGGDVGLQGGADGVGGSTVPGLALVLGERCGIVGHGRGANAAATLDEDGMGTGTCNGARKAGIGSEGVHVVDDGCAGLQGSVAPRSARTSGRHVSGAGPVVCGSRWRTAARCSCGSGTW